MMLPRSGPRNSVKNSLARLIKLTHTFERMGFATDAYLGYLTVSPANLGTAMSFEGSVEIDVQTKQSEEIVSLIQMLDERLARGKGMLVSYDHLQSHGRMEIAFQTNQTLAPNYNESIQIDDFIFAMQTLAELVDSVAPSEQ